MPTKSMTTMLEPFNVDAVSFISMTLIEEAHSRGDGLMAWNHVTLYRTDSKKGHIVIEDWELETAKMYQILGWCRYHGVSHSITSGYLPAMPGTTYEGLDVVEEDA